MSYIFIDKPMPSSKRNLKQPHSLIASYITIHNTNNSAPASNEVSYMQGNSLQTGFHVAIDEAYVIKCADFNRNAWHAGDGANGLGNRKSIGIEICRSTGDINLFKKAEQNCAEYVAKLLKEYGWGIDRVKRHKDWSGKYCPHKTMDLGWQRFLDMIQAELNKLNGQTTQPQKPTVNTSSEFKVGNYDNYVVTSDDLNVRGGRNANTNKLTTIPKGTKVKVSYVMYQDNSASPKGDLWGGVAYNGVTGYINLRYVKPAQTGATGATNMRVRINTDSLNVRKQPNTSSQVISTVKKDYVFTIVEVNGDWGLLKSYESGRNGWINLKYTKKL